MLLYALCLNPLLQILADTLGGIQITPRGDKTAVVAYADDTSIFIHDTEDIEKIQKALDTYTKATGAKINAQKYKALAVGTWDTNVNIMNIPYVTELKILGITFTALTEHSRLQTWAGVAAKVKGLTAKAYARDLCLTQRIWLCARLHPSCTLALGSDPTPTTGCYSADNICDHLVCVAREDFQITYLNVI
jgi:hypothetical protein